MLGVRELRLYDTDPGATAKLKLNLEALSIPGLDTRVCAGTAEAVRGADIVTTVTADKRNALILTPDMIEPGMHLNAVGGDCPGKTELHVDILRRKDARIVVEFEPQARIEGEIQQLDASERVTELADVLCQKQPGRLDEREVTIFDSVGFALNDFSSLRYLHRVNREFGDMDVIDLIPALGDPKDLFGGLVHGESGAKQAAHSGEPRADAPRANRRRTAQPRHSQALARKETLA
jgi:ornithine cyclodeaminase